MLVGKYRFFARRGYPVSFATAGISVNEKVNPNLSEHITLPDVNTSDIITFSGKMVESGANLNRAYFGLSELIEAYNTIPFKAVDLEHELERVVGHIWSHAYVDRKTNKRIELADLQSMSPEQLATLKLDVMIGGVTYIDRFPQLASPIKRKAYSLSMECYFNNFDLMLENGVRITLDEAQALGLDGLVENIMGEFTEQDSFDKAHRVNVILADKTEVPMKVFKYLQGIVFSGVAYVLNPACPTCTVMSTNLDAAAPDCKDGCSMDDCKTDKDPAGCMDDCMDECDDMMGSAAGHKAQADQMLTINLTKLDSYMAEWRKSSQGKPLNHQVKEGIIAIVSTDDVIEEDKETSDSLRPFSQERDPNSKDKKPSICPQYKYEIWVQQGDTEEEQKRHWCIYGNDKCPTAGDRTFHECMRWYKRESDWIMDLRTFRDEGNPFAPDGYDQEAEDSIMMQSSSLEFKRMDAMVDSYLYQVEAMRREKEIVAKANRKVTHG